MRSEDARRIYLTRLQTLMQKNAKIKQDQDEADRVVWEETQAKTARQNAYLTLAGLYKDLKEGHEMKLVEATYGKDPTEAGIYPKKFETPDPRSFREMWEDIGTGENIKRGVQNILPGKLGAYRETAGYKKYKAKIELDLDKMGLADVDNAILREYDLTREDLQGLVNKLEGKGITLGEGILDQEQTVKLLSRYDEVLQDPAKLESFEEILRQTGQNPDMLPAAVEDLIENTDKTLEAVSEGTYTPTGQLAYEEYPGEQDITIDELGEGRSMTEGEYYEGETVGDATLDELGTRPDVSIAEEEFIVTGQDMPIAQGVTPTEVSDPELEKAIKELEELKAPPVEGADKVLPEQLRASVGMSDMPDVEAPITTDVEAPITTDVSIPDAEPGLLGNVAKYGGETLNALQKVQDISNIGKVLTDEEASDADKALAGTRGVKMLADMAAKKAGQETASQIGSKAATQFIKGKGLQEGVKLGGKQAVGAAAGGLIGGYTAITEAKEAGESWEEGDYDEAILHGIGSVSGGLQTAGAGMMLSGVGAPLGAVLYGVGTAASAISSGALFLESLFGGDDTVQEVKTPKFDAGSYLASLRASRAQGRRYY